MRFVWFKDKKKLFFHEYSVKEKSIYENVDASGPWIEPFNYCTTSAET